MSNENSSREIVYTQDEVIIKDIYILKNKEKIGGGSFGQIYKGYNKKSGKKLAIKMELNTAKTPLLQTEYKSGELFSFFNQKTDFILLPCYF